MTHFNFIYLLTPFVAWLFSGFIKFFINCIFYKDNALKLIGYGGFPSTHSAIVSSSTVLIFIDKSFTDSALLVSVTLMFIVCLDAVGLRKEIELHAKILNKLLNKSKHNFSLRERIGHSFLDIFGGILIGSIVGASFFFTNNYF